MGISGSVRINALTASALAAMQNHEKRLDISGAKRSIRKGPDGKPVPPLIWSKTGADLEDDYAAQCEGTKRNKGAGKSCLHAFVQFPTDLPLTPETEKQMLQEAVDFVNQNHGGDAVFRARLDRDEAGRHGVDVFFAPRYEKITKRGSTSWISLTKFGKALALERFGQQPLERKNSAGKFETVLDAAGDQVMVDCNSAYFQGRALQDCWFEHLHDQMGLDWVERGERKIGRDPDRLEVEEYKLQQDLTDAQEFGDKIIEAAIKAAQRVTAKEAADAEKRAVEAQVALKATQAAITDAQGRLGALRADTVAAEEEAIAIRIQANRYALETQLQAQQTAQTVLQNEKTALAAERAKLAAQKDAQEKTAEWVEIGVGNLQAAINRVQAGTYDTEILPSDMPDQPKQFSALKAAAPDNRPTLGFRTRFWALNFSDGSGPSPLPEKIRTSLTKAFDRVALWAAEVGKARIAAQTAMTAAREAAQGLLDTAKTQAAQITQQATQSAHTERAAILQKAKEDAENYAPLAQTIEAIQRAPEGMRQAALNLEAYEEVMQITLRRLGVADKRIDLFGEYAGQDRDPPPVMELVMNMAERRAKQKTDELVATLNRGYSPGR